MSWGFDCNVFFIFADNLSLLILYSAITFSTFFIVEFLFINSLLRSVICSETMDKFNATWALASPVAEEICCSIVFFSSFKISKRASASAFNL